MQLQNRLIRLFVVPPLLAAMVVGPVWATPLVISTDTSSGSGPAVEVTVVNPTPANPHAADGITVNQAINLETTTTDPSILISGDNVFSGTVQNNGHIDDGIEITGNVTSTAVNGVVRVENTNADREASLHDGLIIKNNKTVTSSASDTVFIGQDGYVDFINVESGSTLDTTGSGKHAINVATGGQLGGGFTNDDGGGAHQVSSRSETDTVIDASGIISASDGAAINISSGAQATGRIAVSGTLSGKENSGGDGDGAIIIGGTFTGTIENTGNIDDAIVITGTHSATTGSNHAITSSGTLGSSTSETVIQVDGTLSSTGGNAVNLGGTIRGSILNNQSISGGIVISGDQDADGSAYQSIGTSSSDISTLTGGITISGSMTTSSSAATISIGNFSNVDTITVNSSSTLENTSTGPAIFVGNDNARIDAGIVNNGTIDGNIDNDGTITGGIDNNGTFTGTIDNAGIINGGIDNSSANFIGNINNTGTVNGAIVNSGTIAGNITNSGTIADGINSTGTITGSISNSSIISNGITVNNQTATGAAAYSSTGTSSLAGGYTVTGTVTSNQDAVDIGDGTNVSTVDSITINNGATLSGGTGLNAIDVAANSTVTTSITNSGTLGDQTNKGGTIANAGTVNAITNSGTIHGDINNTGTITNAINSSTGTINGSIINNGSINGGIVLNNQNAGSAVAYSSTGGSLTGAYDVDGTVETDNANAVSVGTGSSIDTITVDGTLTAGNGGNAINVASGGTITTITNNSTLGRDSGNKGGSIVNAGTITTITNASNLHGDISNSGTITTISSTGTINGEITNSNNIGTITVKDQDAGSEAAYSSSGSATLTSYTVSGDVTAGANAVSIGGTSSVGTITITNDAGAKLKGSTNAINVVGSVTTGIVNNGAVEGNITNNGTIEAITNSGTFTGSIDNNSGTIKTFTNASTMTGNIDNDATINDIVNSGTLTGSINNNSTITNGINSTGTINGSINNSGSIGSGVIVTTQTATGAAYLGNNSSTLSGVYDVRGAVKSTGEHAVNLLSGSRVDQIKVSSGSLIAEAANKNAIQLASGSTIHDGSASESETLISIENGATVNATGSGGIGLNIDTNLTGLTQILNGGTLSGNALAINIAAGRTYTGSIVNSGNITNKIYIANTATHTATNDALSITSTGQLGSVEGNTIIEVDGDLNSTSGNAINIAGTTTGKILVNGTISDGAVSIAAGGNYTGTLDVSGGSISDGVVINGTHTSAADGIHIASSSSIGSNAAGNAIAVGAAGSLTSTASGGKAINLNGGTLIGTIRNEGSISGNIFIDGTQTATNSAYYSKGTSGDRAALNGSYTVAANRSVTTANDTVFVDEYSDISNVTVASNATLSSTGTNKRAIYIAANAHLNSGSESSEALSIAGTLSSTNGSAIEVQGSLTGKLMIEATGVVTGKGGATDAAILLDGAGTHVGSIENRGVITGGIYIDQNQTASNQAYISQGSSGDWAVLSGINDQGGGYTIDSGVTVASSSNAVEVGNYSYLDSIVVNGTLSATDTAGQGSSGGESAVYISTNGQLGGTFGSINRQVTDTVIEVEGTLSSVSGYAIKMDGNVAGNIRVDDGATLSGDTADGSIAVNKVFLGAVKNLGTITGNINVSGVHQVASGALYHGSNSSTFNESYIVKSGGVAYSLNGTEILAENTSIVGGVKVESGGVLGQSANNTIKAESGATINSVELSGTLNGSSIVNGKIGTFKVNSGGVATSISDHTLAVNSGGRVDKIQVDGRLSSLSASKNAISIQGALNNPSDANDQTYTAMSINGEVSSSNGTAINIGSTGSVTGQIVIGANGEIGSLDSSSNGVKIQGSYKGRLSNSGYIQSGLVVDGGTHTSANQAYYASGTSSVKSLLVGGYKVTNGGSVSSATDAIHIDNYGSIDSLEVSGSGSNLQSTGSGNSAIYIGDGGTIGTSSNTSGIHITNGGLVTGTSDSTSAAIKVDGSVVGKVAVTNGGQLGSHASAFAVNFTGADTALNFEQTGASSFTKGRIYGSSQATDTVSIREGSFQGNFGGIEHLIISDDSNISITGDFTLPTKTTVYLDNSLTANKALMTSSGTVYADANRSNVTFVPEDNSAYLNLYRNGPVVTVVDAQSVDTNALGLIDISSGSVLLQADSYVEGDDIKVRLRASESEDLNGVMGHALLAALDPNADQVKSQQILSTLNQSESVVGAIEDDVRPDISGHPHLAAREMTFSTQSIVFDRIDSLRGSGVNFGDGFGFGLYGDGYEEEETVAEQSEEDEYVDPDLPRKRQIRNMDYTLLNGGTFWGQMMYLEGTQDKKSRADGFKNRAGGIVIGADTIVLDSFRLGLAATYGFGVVNTDGGRSTESHNFLGTLYSSWEDGHFFVDTILSAGGARNNTDKTVNGKKVTGDYDSFQWNLRLVGGARIPFASYWELVPMAELNYGKVTFDSYVEKGSPFVQKVEIQDYSALELGLGFSIKGLFQQGKTYVEPDFTFMAHRDINTTGSKVQFTFVAGGSPAFVEGAERDAQRYQTGFGLNFDMGSNWYIRTAYDYRWSTSYRSHSLNARFRYDF